VIYSDFLQSPINVLNEQCMARKIDGWIIAMGSMTDGDHNLAITCGRVYECSRNHTLT